MEDIDFGLLAIRAVVGVLMVGHGIGNLFPERWVSGLGAFGLEGTARIFEKLGFRPGRAFAALAGTVEIGAGALLTLGLLTPLGAAGVIGVMVSAILTRHRGNGPWYYNGGWEYNATLLVVAAAVAFTGPGATALDPALGLDLAGWAWGSAGLALGLFTGVAVLGLRRRPAAPAGAVADPAEVT